MLSPALAGALLAAGLWEPASLADVPVALLAPGPERMLLVGLQAGAIRCTLVERLAHVALGADVLTAALRDAGEPPPNPAALDALRALIRWCATAPAVVIAEGQAALATHVWAVPAEPTGPLAPIGARHLWARELEAGLRTRTTFDELWRAAVYEAEAMDAERYGDRTGADTLLRRAGRCLLQYRDRRVPAA